METYYLQYDNWAAYIEKIMHKFFSVFLCNQTTDSACLTRHAKKAALIPIIFRIHFQ